MKGGTLGLQPCQDHAPQQRLPARVNALHPAALGSLPGCLPMLRSQLPQPWVYEPQQLGRGEFFAVRQQRAGDGALVAARQPPQIAGSPVPRPNPHSFFAAPLPCGTVGALPLDAIPCLGAFRILFEMAAGIEMVHVPYRGAAPMVTDLLGGQVQSAVDALPTSIEYLRAGKLRALAVTTPTRSPALPDIPTLGDFQPGFEATAWIGIGAPKNTPLEIIDKLNKEVNAGLADPKIAAQIADLAATVFTGSPAELDKLVVEQTEKWGKVIRAANIKPE